MERREEEYSIYVTYRVYIIYSISMYIERTYIVYIPHIL